MANTSELLNMNTDLNTEKNITSGKRFHYHRKGISTHIDGSTGEGIVVMITTGANNAVESCDIRTQFVWV